MRYDKIRFSLIITLMFLSMLIASHSFAYEPFANLKTAAEDFIKKNIPLEADETMEIHVALPSSSLQLTTCSSGIHAAFPGDSNKEQITAVELTCYEPQPWHTYLSVNVQIFTKTIVAKRAIYPNETITEQDIEITRNDRNQLYNGFFKATTDVVGQVAKSRIMPGTVFSKNNIQQPLLVHRNQIIDLIARSNSVVVTMKGIAKSDGAINESIKAFNPSSKKTLDAVVVGTNQAEVIS